MGQIAFVRTNWGYWLLLFSLAITNIPRLEILTIEPLIHWAWQLEERQISSQETTPEKTRSPLSSNHDWFSSKGKEVLQKGDRVTIDGKKIRVTSPRYPCTKENPKCRNGRPHHGTDIATEKGIAIAAPQDGEVFCPNTDPHGWGKFALLANSQGQGYALLAHLDRCTPGKVKEGELVGKTGDTGKGTGPHLHIELFLQPFDPEKELRGLSRRDVTREDIEQFF